MAESDVENHPSPSSTVGNNTSSNEPNKKLIVSALSIFLLAAVVLSIALGVTLGNDDGNTGDDGSSANNVSTSNTTSDTADIKIDNNTTSDINVEVDDAPQFIWFTDVHYDQYYGTERAAYHGNCPGYDQNYCNRTDSPKYSVYGCGSSAPLVESFLSEASRVTEGKPDFVLFTGDATRHFADKLGEDRRSVVLNATRYLYNTTKAYFPNVPVYQLPSINLGNNDWTPHDMANITSYDACVVGVNGELPKSTNEYLQDVASNNKENFADEIEESIFKCGGYTRREVIEGLVIVSLNTMVYGTKLNKAYNDKNPENQLYIPDQYTEDPFGQLEWLQQELSECRLDGKKVYITGHHPPVSQSVIVKAGDDLWKEGFKLRFEKIVSDYSDVVSGMLFGHVHTNELRCMPYMPSSAAPLMLQGAVAPGYCMDPNFSIVKYNSRTKAPTDVSKYFAKVEEAYQMNSSVLTWNEEIKSTLDLLGMESFTNEAVQSLANRAMGDEALWSLYWNMFTKGRPQEVDCTGDCIHQEACVIACGSSKKLWYSCEIGYGDCLVGDIKDLDEDLSDNWHMTEDYEGYENITVDDDGEVV